MAMADQRDPDAEIVVGETGTGEDYTLPIEEVLTGRLFVTGKSGAGKSNTGSVVAALARAGGASTSALTAGSIEPLMDDVSTSTVSAVLRALFDAGVVRREKDGRSYQYCLDQDFLERRIEVHEQTRG